MTHSGALSLARPTLFTCPLFILLSSCVIVSYVSLPMTQFLYTEGWYFVFTNVLPTPHSRTQYQAVHNGHFIHLFALSRSATPQSCLETSQVNPQGVSCLSLEATSWEYWEICGTRASFIKTTKHQLRMKKWWVKVTCLDYVRVSMPFRSKYIYAQNSERLKEVQEQWL